MLKTIFIFISFFCVHSANCFPLKPISLSDPLKEIHSTSQPDTVTTENIKKVNLILKAGVNLSHMNFNKGYHPNIHDINPAWKTGFFAGAAIQIRLPHKFSLTQDYILTRRRGQYSPSETLYTLDYISLPLLLGYKINKKISVLSGPQLELLIAGKEISEGEIKNITKITEERSVGWVVGLQYAIFPQCFLDARFMHGLNAIGINQRQNRTEFRYELFQISVNYLFK